MCCKACNMQQPTVKEELEPSPVRAGKSRRDEFSNPSSILVLGTPHRRMFDLLIVVHEFDTRIGNAVRCSKNGGNCRQLM